MNITKLQLWFWGTTSKDFSTVFGSSEESMLDVQFLRIFCLNKKIAWKLSLPSCVKWFHIGAV